MQKLNLFIVAMVMLICYSCNDHSEPLSSYDAEEVLPSRGAQTEMPNFNKPSRQFGNPQAIAGIIHNLAMDSVQYLNVEIDSIPKFSYDFSGRHMPKVAGLDNFDLQFKSRSIRNLESIKVDVLNRPYDLSLDNAYFSNKCDSLIAKFNPSVQVKLRSILAIVEYPKLMDSLSISNAFQNVNISIYDDNSLIDEEKLCLLAVSAITEASIEYNYGLETFYHGAQVVVKADFYGAVGGLFSWSFLGKTVASGLMFGPTGAVVAATKEIVKGAIAGSAVQLIGHLLFE